MDFLYQDDRVIVAVKPAGVLSTDEPGGMPELIRRELGQPDANVRSVHRLDRPVGGVMVYARTRRAASDLSRQIREGLFQKEYLAVVHGVLPERQGELHHMLARDKQAHRTYIAQPEDPEAREAILRYKTMFTDEETSLLSVALLTGRTHQIRCQLSAVGHPLLGDGKYGAPDGGERPALWACGLSFLHPRTGERLTFHAPAPDEEPWSRFSLR